MYKSVRETVAMQLFAWTMLMVCWFAWFYPFIFRAPHNQKRPSITSAGPTRLGLLFESAAIFMAFAIRLPADSPPGRLRCPRDPREPRDRPDVPDPRRH